MLEVAKKKMVTTRKEHKCYFCGEMIAKSEQAVNVSAKEDGKYKSLHMHVACNIAACKIDLFEEGLPVKSPAGDFSVNSLAENEYPF